MEKIAGKGKSSISILLHHKDKEKEWEKYQEKSKVWLTLSNIWSYLEATLWKHVLPQVKINKQKKHEKQFFY